LSVTLEEIMKRVVLAFTMAASILVCVCGCAAPAPAQEGGGAKQKLNVAILIFDGVQIIDYTGPYEALGAGRQRNVYTVAERPDVITTAMGMKVVPNYTFANQPKPDVIVVPGGGNSGEPGSTPRGVGAALKSEAVINWIRESAARSKYVMSVCNGAFLLQKAGLLDGLSATTTAGYIDYLATIAPKTKVVSDQRYVDNGKIITTGGLSAGIDGAMRLVEKLDGRGAAIQTALGIEYNWQPESGWARAALADQRIPNSIYDAFYTAGTELLDLKDGLDKSEEVWRTPSELSAAEMLKRIEEKWVAVKWTRAEGESVQKVAAAGDATAASRWRRADASGKTWEVAVNVRPAAEARGQLTITLSVARI
jgi:putative intracellular protease/amidase